MGSSASQMAVGSYMAVPPPETGQAVLGFQGFNVGPQVHPSFLTEYQEHPTRLPQSSDIGLTIGPASLLIRGPWQPCWRKSDNSKSSGQ